MSAAFVRPHRNIENHHQFTIFHEQQHGWSSARGPGGMTMFTGDRGSFAATGTHRPVVAEFSGLGDPSDAAIDPGRKA